MRAPAKGQPGTRLGLLRRFNLQLELFALSEAHSPVAVRELRSYRRIGIRAKAHRLDSYLLAFLRAVIRTLFKAQIPRPT